MVKAYCPDCEEPIQLKGTPRLGMRLTCPSCGSELELISVDPPAVDWAYDDEEDENEDLYEDSDSEDDDED